MSTKTITSVFVVENDNLFVKMLEYIFTKPISYQFRDFSSAEECISNLHFYPSVVVIDYLLPGMDGFQAIRKIRRKNPGAHIIVLLDDKNARKAKDMIKEGADEYIIKEGNVVPAIIRKLEDYFVRRADLPVVPLKRQPFPILKAVCFFILILMLVSAGIYYY
jgi:DNA-binding NarL/FixJ family response regulator